jgi:hypothetical protein
MDSMTIRRRSGPRAVASVAVAVAVMLAVTSCEQPPATCSAAEAFGHRLFHDDGNAQLGRLIATPHEHAAAAGCEWLHVGLGSRADSGAPRRESPAGGGAP